MPGLAGFLGFSVILGKVFPAYQPIDPLWPIDSKEQFWRRSPICRSVLGLIDAAGPLPSSDPPESATCVGPIG
jgi:hypothetical protein